MSLELQYLIELKEMAAEHQAHLVDIKERQEQMNDRISTQDSDIKDLAKDVHQSKGTIKLVISLIIALLAAACSAVAKLVWT